jgi:hypothetical protein
VRGVCVCVWLAGLGDDVGAVSNLFCFVSKKSRLTLFFPLFNFPSWEDEVKKKRDDSLRKRFEETNFSFCNKKTKENGRLEFILFLQTKTPMIFQRSNRDTTENSVRPEANRTNSHPSTSYFFFLLLLPFQPFWFDFVF